MKKILLVFIALFSLALYASAFTKESAKVADFGTKTPLTIEFIIDTKMLEEITVEEIEKTVFQITGIANDAFSPQIGRYLAIAKITYDEGLPAEINKNIVLDERVLWWLLARHKNTDLTVFLTQRPLTHKGFIAVGIGSEGGGASMITLNSDLTISVNILLHEIGHNCGAQHSDDTNSLMHKAASRNLTYDKESLKIIKENCG